MSRELIFTNDNCIGCNQCVRICRSFGASISRMQLDKSVVTINSDRCINCGACIDVCRHHARDYHDDTEQFLQDLEHKEKISVLIAPSFAAKYPEEYKMILGKLKALGVCRILPVSIGADICTWAYARLLMEEKDGRRISTTCPVVVSFVEHWMPEMIPRLMPVKSPMMCAAVYFRKELGITDKMAFIGPCIGKKIEVDKYPELIQYNVTFPKLIGALRKMPDVEDAPIEELKAGLGNFYPAPGGLADNLRWLMGDDLPVRVLSGKTYLYQRLVVNRSNIFTSEAPYTLIDALNCREGCMEGTARLETEDGEDRGLWEMNRIRARSKNMSPSSPWNPLLSSEERWQNLCTQFEGLKLEDYLTTFRSQNEACTVHYPSEEEAEEIYCSMHKEKPEDRQINCSACGYSTCREMMIAIHNGFNIRENCVYYEKEEALFLMKMSYSDHLTNVMNRNALEGRLDLTRAFKDMVGVIAVDVNGLKAVNDTLGHDAGDRLIVETANALAHNFGRERVFRVGGDEFLVILHGFEREEIEDRMIQVKEQLAAIDVFVSMGLAFSESFKGNIERLRKTADQRMYEDKERYYSATGKKRRG